MPIGAASAGRWLRSQASALWEAAARGERPALGAVGVGLCALVLGGGCCLHRDQRPPDGPPVLSVITWNVLARPYTKYNSEAHRASTKVEEPAQTRQRYTLAGEELASRSADLVLLQECESPFFESDWNPAAAKLLQSYEVFRCPAGPQPGTAVLVKRGGRAAPLARAPVCVGGTEQTGGSSKVATVLPVRVGAAELTAVSVHFTWDAMAAQRLHHAGLVAQALAASPGGAIVGGDFNCEPGAALAALEAGSFLGRLRRAPLPEGTATGLDSGLAKGVCIDHVYLSADLAARMAVALATPRSPWGGKVTRPAKVAGASDHVPVLVEVVLPAETVA